jgi:hypothetical protein
MKKILLSSILIGCTLNAVDNKSINLANSVKSFQSKTENKKIEKIDINKIYSFIKIRECKPNCVNPPLIH